MQGEAFRYHHVSNMDHLQSGKLVLAADLEGRTCEFFSLIRCVGLWERGHFACLCTCVNLEYCGSHKVRHLSCQWCFAGIQSTPFMWLQLLRHGNRTVRQSVCCTLSGGRCQYALQCVDEAVFQKQQLCVHICTGDSSVHL